MEGQILALNLCVHLVIAPQVPHILRVSIRRANVPHISGHFLNHAHHVLMASFTFSFSTSSLDNYSQFVKLLAYTIFRFRTGAFVNRRMWFGWFSPENAVF